MLKIKPKSDKRGEITKLQKNLQNLTSKEKRGKTYQKLQKTAQNLDKVTAKKGKVHYLKIIKINELG